MYCNKYLGLLLGACTLAASVLSAPLLANGDITHKLAPSVRLAMTAQKNKAVHAKGALAKKEAAVLIKTSDNGAQAQTYLAQNGGRITSRHGNIICAQVPYAALPGLASLGQVTYIDAPKKLHTTNNEAAGSKYGTKLTDILKANPKYTGKGVVVGVIDTGIDTSCEAFNDANGKSRISYFWDTSSKDTTHYPTVITPEGESRTYAYGREYTAADIDSQTDAHPYFTDPIGHGTHVCGTIGGRDEKYPGMAPEVNYIVVNLYNDNPEGYISFFDGVEYIISRAREMNRPLVLNMSIGSDLGPHDGTSLYDQAIQADVIDHNLITCVSAGNSNINNHSSQVTIPAHDSVIVNMLAPTASPEYMLSGYDSLEIWTTGNNDIDLTLAEGTNSRTIAYNESIEEGEDFGKYQLYCYKEFINPDNGDDNFLLSIIDNSCEKASSFPATLKITNNGDTETTVHMYLYEYAKGCFLDHVCSGTVSTPGSTPGVITVGAYTTRTQWDSITGPQGTRQTLGHICDFSSQGPPRRSDQYTGLNATKPDIAAPGSMLISQHAVGYEEDEKMIIDDRHVAMHGTSVAAPVVTGTVALILQNMPNATAAQIKEILFDKALSDNFTGTTPNNIFGHGKLQATSLESALIVSPQPTITQVARDTQNDTDLVISGENFALACDVYINGVLWNDNNITYNAHSELIAHKVFDPNSPLCSNGRVIVETVKVVNRLGKEGANSYEFNTGKEDSDGSLRDSSGGCFIATAAYGSYLEPEVMALRRFRDRDLLTNEPGRYFVKMYYTYSPPVADFIAAHPSARFATRLALTPLVYSVSHPSEALALALLFGLTGCAVWRTKRENA